MAPPFAQLYRPDYQVILVPLLLSRATLIQQQIQLAIHLQHSIPTTLPLVPSPTADSLVRPPVSYTRTIAGSQLLLLFPFLPRQTRLHTPILSKEKLDYTIPLLTTLSQLPNTRRKTKVFITPCMLWLLAPSLWTSLYAPATLPLLTFLRYIKLQPKVFALAVSSAEMSK